MNHTLEVFARQSILDGLLQLTEFQRRIFMLLYSHENLDADIKDVVREMPVEKLDWAMKQVEGTLLKKENG